MFNHIKSTHKWPKVKRKNINGTRHYIDEEYNIYHSVTKVVGSIPKPGLDIWKQRLAEQYGSEEAGEAVAKSVMIKAGLYGTKLHKMVEYYLDNDRMEVDNLFAAAHFKNIKPLLSPIDNILEQEIQMFSKRMGLAGTADCVAEFNGKLSIIDFKTSTKLKKEEHMESYYLQATCYALMWEENTGQVIDQIVILMSGEDGSQSSYIKDKAQYINRLFEVIASFKANADV